MQSKPYTTLTNLLEIGKENTLPSRQGLAFVIRHAPRANLQTLKDVYEADLTPEGWQAAREFGSALRSHFYLRGLFSSPILRCIHTAEAIRTGYQANIPIYSFWWLFSPFLAPQRYTSDYSLNHKQRIDIFSRQGIEEKAISSIDTQRLSIILHRIKIPLLSNELFLYITHDSTVAPLYALLNGESAIYVEDYPDYLQGILFTKINGQVMKIP